MRRSAKKFANAGIAGISIERAASKAKVVIATSRPGIIIGRRGAGVEQLKEELQKLTENELFIDIQEVRKAETNAQLVAENIATQLERRVAFRRAMKKAVSIAMKFGAKGIRVEASGRLGGSEIARDEKYREGRVPLHTLRADIDYGTAIAAPPPARSASRSGSSRVRCSRSAAARSAGQRAAVRAEATRRISPC